MRKRLGSNVVLVALVFVALLAPQHHVEAATKKKSSKKRPTTTTPRPKVRFVWMCDLMSKIDMNVIPDHNVERVLNPFQKGGNRSDWRTEDLSLAAQGSSGACQAFYSGTEVLSHSVAVSQAFKQTERFFESAPDWDPSFTWTKVKVDGITADTWMKRNGKYKPSNNIVLVPSCYIGVRTVRGVFYTQIQFNKSLETDKANVDCAFAEEAMRRTLAALEAGGYKYLT